MFDICRDKTNQKLTGGWRTGLKWSGRGGGSGHLEELVDPLGLVDKGKEVGRELELVLQVVEGEEELFAHAPSFVPAT